MFVTGREFGKAVCQVLGLNELMVSSIRIDITPDDIVKVYVTQYADSKDSKQIQNDLCELLLSGQYELEVN